MSKRTAAASKAVREAWVREQQLVQNGQGTRDWTLQQQKDIIEKGKAYDDNGKAFEGHHMKSAEAYPKFQGEPDNIQFLTRAEHLSAHEGSFQNPTNGYYDYITKATQNFDLNEYVSCQIITLSNSIHQSEISNRSIPRTQKKNIFRQTKEKLRHFLEKSEHFIEKHPIIAALLAGGVAAIGKKAVNKFEKYGTENNEGFDCLEDSDNSSTVAKFDNDFANEEINSSENAFESNKHSPKRPHDTRSYERIRNGKVEHVRGYSTGRNKE